MSELENIAGIGDKTIDVLLTKYKSVNQIKKAKIEDLETSIGKAKAKLLIDYFKIKQNSNE